MNRMVSWASERVSECASRGVKKKDNYDCPLAFASNSALYLFILLWFFLDFFFFLSLCGPLLITANSARVTFRIFVVSTATVFVVVHFLFFSSPHFIPSECGTFYCLLCCFEWIALNVNTFDYFIFMLNFIFIFGIYCNCAEECVL